MKKAVLIVAIVTLLAGFPVIDAKAVEWHCCNVTSVGQLGDSTAVQLTEPNTAITNRWYLPLSTKSKEMLATAMFAAANNRKVWVAISSTTEYSTIISIALAAQ